MTADLPHSIKNALRTSHPGKSYSQMAREMGVMPLTLQKAVKGKTTPHRATIERIAAYCDVDPDAILTGYGSMPPGKTPQQRKPRKRRKGAAAKRDGASPAAKAAAVTVGDAYRRGFADGFADGYQRGLAEVNREQATTIAFDPAMN